MAWCGSEESARSAVPAVLGCWGAGSVTVCVGGRPLTRGGTLRTTRGRELRLPMCDG